MVKSSKDKNNLDFWLKKTDSIGIRYGSLVFNPAYDIFDKEDEANKMWNYRVIDNIHRGVHPTCIGADKIIAVWIGIGWIDISYDFFLALLEHFNLSIDLIKYSSPRENDRILILEKIKN